MQFLAIIFPSISSTHFLPYLNLVGNKVSFASSHLLIEAAFFPEITKVMIFYDVYAVTESKIQLYP